MELPPHNAITWICWPTRPHRPYPSKFTTGYN